MYKENASKQKFLQEIKWAEISALAPNPPHLGTRIQGVEMTAKSGDVRIHAYGHIIYTD